MANGAIRWLARFVLTGLLIGSLLLAGLSLHTLVTSPAGAAFVARSAEGIAAASERALATHATPQALTARIDLLLQEEPRNWLAIDAVAALAVERAIPLPEHLIARRTVAWEADSGFWKGAGDCLQCIRDANTCDLTLLLICRGPIDLTPIGDVRGVLEGGADYLAGRDVDEVDVILSVIGLSAVTLGLWSGGSSLSIKTGAGFAKLARAQNRLPDTLTAPFLRAFREGIEWHRWREIGRGGLSQLLRPEVMRPAGAIASDMGQLVRGTGARTALHMMKYVDSPADLSRMTRAAEALGPRMVGTVEVLGKSRLIRLTLRVADEVWLLATGVLGALAALLGLVQSALSTGILRMIRRLARAPIG